MAEPTSAEVDAVAEAIEYMHPLTISSSRDRARLAIAALDKARGETVPVDKLKRKLMRDLWTFAHPVKLDCLVSWLDRRGWLDDETPVVQTERRKP